MKLERAGAPGATTLLIHAPGDVFARRVVAILADWHACGWLGDIATVSTAELQRRGADVGNVVATRPPGPDGGPQRVRIRDLIDGPGLRLVAIDPVGPTAAWVARRRDLHSCCAALAGSLLGRRLGMVDLVVPWHGGHWDPQMTAWPGWDTIIAAPEESATPTQAGLALFCDPEDPRQVGEVAANAAVFTAAACGLWTAAGPGVFDDSESSDELRLGRASHRRMDASALADALRECAFDRRMLHDPRAQLAVSDQELARRVNRLRERIALMERTPEPPPSGPVDVSALETLRMFFSFMFPAMLRAPADVAGALVHLGRSKLATELQRRLFGPGSAFRVSVRGVQAVDGTQAAGAKEEQLEALRRAAAGVAGVQMPEAGTGVSQRYFWSGTFENAFALASGSRVGETDPYSDSVPRYFQPEAIAPPIPAPWVPQSGVVPGVPIHGIEVHDVAAVVATERELRARSADESSALRAGAEMDLQRLQAAAAPWRASFLGRVGALIAQSREAEEARMQALLTQAGQGTDGFREVEDLAKRLGRFAKRATAVAGVIGLVLALLNATLLGALPLGLLLVVVVVVWLLSLFGAYWRVHRRLFELRHRAKEAERDFDRALVELPIAVENAARLARMYSQYLAWAPALSCFLAEPFGRAAQASEQFPAMVGYIAKSLSCGVYQVADPDLAHQLADRTALAHRDSIDSLWRVFVEASRSALISGSTRFESVQMDELYSLAETGPDSFLANWLAAWLERGADGARVRGSVAADIDARLMQRLRDDLTEDELATLRSAYRVAKVGSGGTPTAERFDEHDTPAQFNVAAFSADGLHAGARNIDPATVRVTHSAAVLQRATRHWLDEVDTVVAFGAHLEFGYLELKGRQAPGDRGDAHPGSGPTLPRIGLG